MRKIILLILLAFSTTSCAATPRISAKKTGINEEFKPYIQNYKYIIGEKKYSNKFKYLHMNFADLEGSIIGRCWWLLNGEYEVEIDINYWKWNEHNFLAKEFLIYHELEHCIRSRMHTNKQSKIESIEDFFEEIGFQLGIIKRLGYLKDGCPASIMHSHAFSDNCRIKHRYYYFNEMRNWKH